MQGGAALAKGMFPELGAIGTVTLRIALSALILAIVFRPPLLRFQAAQWRAVVPYGVVLGVMNISFYLALQRIPLGLAVTLEFTGPLAVAVLGSRRGRDVLWIALAGIGVALIAPRGGGSSNINGSGVCLALIAGACWGTYIVLGGRVSRLFAGSAGVAAGMLFATLTVVPIALATHSLAHMRPALLGTGFGVAMLSSALPYSLEMVALRAMPARTFGILMSAEPAIGALSGLVFLGEHLRSSQWLAVVLVMLASAGAALSSRRIEVATEV